MLQCQSKSRGLITWYIRENLSGLEKGIYDQDFMKFDGLLGSDTMDTQTPKKILWKKIKKQQSMIWQ